MTAPTGLPPQPNTQKTLQRKIEADLNKRFPNPVRNTNIAETIVKLALNKTDEAERKAYVKSAVDNYVKTTAPVESPKIAASTPEKKLKNQIEANLNKKFPNPDRNANIAETIAKLAFNKANETERAKYVQETVTQYTKNIAPKENPRVAKSTEEKNLQQKIEIKLNRKFPNQARNANIAETITKLALKKTDETERANYIEESINNYIKNIAPVEAPEIAKLAETRNLQRKIAKKLNKQLNDFAQSTQIAEGIAKEASKRTGKKKEVFIDRAIKFHAKSALAPNTTPTTTNPAKSSTSQSTPNTASTSSSSSTTTDASNTNETHSVEATSAATPVKPATEAPKTETTKTENKENENKENEGGGILQGWKKTKLISGAALLAGGIALKMTLIGIVPGLIMAGTGAALMGWGAINWAMGGKKDGDKTDENKDKKADAPATENK